jgi:hypothetical protein
LLRLLVRSMLFVSHLRLAGSVRGTMGAFRFTRYSAPRRLRKVARRGDVELVRPDSSVHLSGHRSSNRLTFPTPHFPPLRVLIPRAVSSAAMARSEVCPAARMSASIGARSAANAAAFADTADLSAAPPFLARRRLSGPFGFPSFTPRAFLTASASFVHREIALRSAKAVCALMPTVRSFGFGTSTATHCTLS